MGGLLLECRRSSAADVCLELCLSSWISRWPRRFAAASLSLGVCQLEVCEGVADRAASAPQKITALGVTFFCDYTGQLSPQGCGLKEKDGEDGHDGFERMTKARLHGDEVIRDGQ